MSTNKQLTYLLPPIAVAVGYYLLGWLSSIFANAAGTVTVIWPSSGLAIVAVLLFRKYTWIGVLIGAFATSFIFRDSIYLSFLTACANTLETVISAWILRKTNFSTSLERINDYLIFLLVAAGIGPIVGVLLGILELYFFNYIQEQNVLYIFLRWWMAHGIGVLMVAPTLLIWRFPSQIYLHSKKHIIELIILILFSIVIGQIVFLDLFHDVLGQYVYGFWILPGIAWVAVRFNRLYTTLFLLLISFQSLYGSFLGIGFFADAIQKTELINLWIFNAMIYITGMTIVLVFHERKEYQKELRLSSLVYNKTTEGIFITDKKTNIIDVNPAFCKITNFCREDVLEQKIPFLKSEKQNPQFYEDMWKNINELGYWQGEIWNSKKGGELFAELLTISIVKNENNSIIHYVGLFTDITLKQQQQEKLEQKAHYDVLTNLPNRALFSDLFIRAASQSQRSNTLLAICFLDLDDFKPINDLHGHDVGDKLLIQVADRIKLNIRGGDTASRIGGDEFTLLVGDIKSMSHCEATLKRINNSLSQPYLIDNLPITIGTSIGATLYPIHGTDLESLIKISDKMMYQAKLKAGNHHVIFNNVLVEQK